MKRFLEYKSLDLPEIEQTILSFWKQYDVFTASVERRRKGPRFVFYEGPPSANGLPGIHHVISRTIKDLFCRYKSLRGYCVERKGGWDTHGLPVELSVEQMLGIRKQDIGQRISVEEFNAICRREVMKYKDAWEQLTERMGYWVDLKQPYITFEKNYIESVWWLLKQFYEKNYLYEGYSVQPYSPAAGTGLSSHELNQPGTYRPIRDVSLIAQFKVIRNAASAWLCDQTPYDVYLLAWTTTPWTLPSNCALTVSPHISYALVETLNPYTLQRQGVVLASDLLSIYFPEQNSALSWDEAKRGVRAVPFRVVTQFSGSALVGLRYEQLMPYVVPEGKAFEVIPGDFVSTEEGTGIVHTASLFGADDYRICQQHGIVSIEVVDASGTRQPLVDQQGRFVPEVVDFAGEYVKEQYLTDEEKEQLRIKQGGPRYRSVDERIADKLKRENHAFWVETVEHNYPHCWRTDKPILYYPLQAWFIRVTACKDQLVELNRTIHWKPASTGEGRFGNWLENVQDWNLSRSRFWGTPLPVWRTIDRSEEICIGSVEELMAESQKAVTAGIATPYQRAVHEQRATLDLHKPFVDDIVLISPSGKPMYRVPDLVDVWFDSGAMPYAQWHYPFENRQLIDEGIAFPADFIAEGVDQTRGWFYTLHVIAGMLFHSVAFKNVVANGLVLDRKGDKMSKRLGNVIDPLHTINQYGADATRWYMISNAHPWDNLKFDPQGVDEIRRSLFGTLFNTYAFFALYANIDGFEPPKAGGIPVHQRSEMDRWILSCLHSLIQRVTEEFDAYNPTTAARMIEEFVDRKLSNWYVRLSRRRFWKGSLRDELGNIHLDKQAAFETLYECLVTVAQLMSPIAPFISDWLYRNLCCQPATNGQTQEITSVHLTDWPVAERSCIDEQLEARFQLAQEISSLALSIRKKTKIKVRQPLQRILVPSAGPDFQRQIEQVKAMILAEINVKQLEFIAEDDPLVRKKVKPNFKKLGKKLGKYMKATQHFLENLTQAQIRSFEKENRITFSIDNQEFEIQIDEVDISTFEVTGWQVASNNLVTVALDVQLTDELIQEGTARELINQVQKLRKQVHFEVTDRIALIIHDHPSLRAAILKHKEYICAETLAESLALADLENDKGTAQEVNVNDVLVKIRISKVGTNDV